MLRNISELRLAHFGHNFYVYNLTGADTVADREKRQCVN
jgi:hypothetical protein